MLQQALEPALAVLAVMVDVRGDLKHAVGARVDDRLAGREVLGAKAFDDFGARRGRIFKHAWNPAALNKRVEDRGRKAVGIHREGAVQHAAHHLPVAGRRVLAGRRFGQAARHRARLGNRRQARHRRHAPEAQLDQARDRQRPAGTREDVIQRVRTLVAKGRRIRQLADPEGVEHDHKHARHA